MGKGDYSLPFCGYRGAPVPQSAPFLCGGKIGDIRNVPGVVDVVTDWVQSVFENLLQTGRCILNSDNFYLNAPNHGDILLQLLFWPNCQCDSDHTDCQGLTHFGALQCCPNACFYAAADSFSSSSPVFGSTSLAGRRPFRARRTRSHCSTMGESRALRI